MKKLLLFLISVFIFLSVSSAQDLTVLHLNDTHSHIEPIRSGKNKGMGGVIEQAAYIDSVRKAEGRRNVLLLHAGDFGQGTSYFTELGGDVEIDVLNAFGYDAVCLGNHEFDNGLEELARRLSDLKVPVVCANYNFSGTPLENQVKPYVIVRKAGKKIGIIGLLTDLSSVLSKDIADLLEYSDPAQAANRYAEYLRNEKGCDLVICLTHLGIEGEFYTDDMLVKQTKDVDLVVGGHSHTLLESEVYVENSHGRKIPVVTDWKWGLHIGKMEIDF